MSVVVTRSNERHSQKESIQQSVKKRYEEAYKLINEALTADENGEKQTAISSYQKALQKLANGISACKGNDQLSEMKCKMERSRDQVSERLKELTTTVKVKPPRPPPPAVAATVSTQKDVVRGSGITGNNTHQQQQQQQNNKQQVDTQAELLYQISEGVGLFQVNSRGNIVKFKDVDGLNVFCFKEKVKGSPPAFIQCGEWVFPLVPGKSPVLKATDITYMFPELQGDDGCSVGLILEGASEDTIKRLDMILSSLALLKESSDVEELTTTTTTLTTTVQPVERVNEDTTVCRKDETVPANWGTTVAAGISTGVGVVSRTVEKGAELANKAIVVGANKLRERMKPSEEPAEIPESVQKGVVVADQVTGVVVGVSDLLLMSLAKMTVQVGKAIGQAVGDSKVVDTSNVNPDLLEAWKVTKAGVSGVAKVFSVLEHNAAALVKTSAEQTTHTVTHKYGNQAGEVTNHSLNTAANVTGLVMTYGSWKKLGISFLSKVGTVLKKQSEDKQQTEQNKSYKVD